MLKGTGTRASKSRLTTFAGARESSHTTFRVDKHERKTRSSSGSCFGKQKSKGKRVEEDRGLMGASDVSSSVSFCSGSASCQVVMWLEFIGGGGRGKEEKQMQDAF
jgi:hypothetical protein